MRRMIGWTVTLVIAVALFASGRCLPNGDFSNPITKSSPAAMSGFRVEGRDAAGRARGRWMVRIDDQGVEAVDNPTARHATH
jgi:hypothetical protein